MSDSALPWPRAHRRNLNRRPPATAMSVAFRAPGRLQPAVRSRASTRAAASRRRRRAGPCPLLPPHRPASETGRAPPIPIAPSPVSFNATFSRIAGSRAVLLPARRRDARKSPLHYVNVDGGPRTGPPPPESVHVASTLPSKPRSRHAFTRLKQPSRRYVASAPATSTPPRPGGLEPMICPLPPTITASLLAIRVGSSLVGESLPPGIVVVAVRGLGHLLPLRCLAAGSFARRSRGGKRFPNGQVVTPVRMGGG